MKKLIPFALIFGFIIHLCGSCDSNNEQAKTEAFVVKVDSLINAGNYSLAQLYADSANDINQDGLNLRPIHLASNIKRLASSTFQDSVLVAMSDEEYKNVLTSKTLNYDYLKDDVLNARLGKILYNRRHDRDYLTRVFKARAAGLTLKQYDRSLAKARSKRLLAKAQDRKKRKTYSSSYTGSNSYIAKTKPSYSSARSGYSSSQCLGITKKGNQCRRMTTAPSGYCWQH